MIALDTNVFIYACDKANVARQRIALDLIANTADAILLCGRSGVSSSPRRESLIDRDFTAADAWARLSEFLDVCPLVMPRSGILERAKDLHLGQRVSFWDAMILAACLDAGIRLLYSEDIPGGHISDIHVVNP